MKPISKVVLGGAMLAGALTAAHASAPLPSTGSSDLMFVVNDASNGTSYTVQLSQIVGSGSGSYFNAADANMPGPVQNTTFGTISGDANFTLNLASDTALQTFISNANAATQTLQWAIMGGAYTGATAGARDPRTNVLTVTTGTDATVIKVSQSGMAGGVSTGFAHDIAAWNTNALDAFNGSGNGIFGTSSAAAGETTLSFYGTSVLQGQSIGASAITLYGITTNGSTAGQGLAYKLGSATFNGSVLTFTGNAPAVPIPAAAWLFGSGLLGLFGIGRRNRAGAAV